MTRHDRSTAYDALINPSRRRMVQSAAANRRYMDCRVMRW